MDESAPGSTPSWDELSLFFHNSIFGAFFMTLDEPLVWESGLDRAAVVEYARHHMRVTKVNATFAEQYGMSPEEMIGRSAYEFFEHDPGQERALLTRIFDAGKHRQLTRERKADGSEASFEGDYVALRTPEGKISGLFGVQKDVTERVRAERELRASLDEKEVLLSEIHHRVKNNLAVVSSLLNLQRYKEISDTAKRELGDSVARIDAMARVHEMLYESDDFRSLRAGEIVERLFTHLVPIFVPDKQIELAVEDGESTLRVGQAIPFALIANEVLTNSMKHAFADRFGGRIATEITEDGETTTVVIADDGVGSARAVESGSNSLGLQIIGVLAEQLRGDFGIDSGSDGTRFVLRFPRW